MQKNSAGQIVLPKNSSQGNGAEVNQEKVGENLGLQKAAAPCSAPQSRDDTNTSPVLGCGF